MVEHCTQKEIDRFSVSALPKEQLDTIAEHLAGCQTCHQRLAETLRRQRGTSGIGLSLSPEFLLRHDHLDYDELVRIADKKLEPVEIEMTDIHLENCSSCRDDLDSLLAFRKQIEPELSVRYGPAAIEQKSVASRSQVFAWRRAYLAAAIVLLIVGLLVGVLYIRRNTGNLEAHKTPPPQTPVTSTPPPTPEDQSARNVTPTPAPVASESPKKTSTPPLLVRHREGVNAEANAGAVAVVKDGTRTIAIDKAGNLSGLDQLPEVTRRDVAEALNGKQIEMPSVETELAGGPMTLRGPDNAPTFKLRSPGRAVIVTDSPSFKWDALPNATSYRVTVGDLNGRAVARSDKLPGDQTVWTLPSPLKRGETYAWDVEATVDGKKVFAPGTSETQMKFKILSSEGARELERLRRANSHLALAVFYAREGMVSEAENEFQILIHDNPNSPVLRNLLKQLQSWRNK